VHQNVLDTHRIDFCEDPKSTDPDFYPQWSHFRKSQSAKIIFYVDKFCKGLSHSQKTFAKLRKTFLPPRPAQASKRGGGEGAKDPEDVGEPVELGLPILVHLVHPSSLFFLDFSSLFFLDFSSLFFLDLFT